MAHASRPLSVTVICVLAAIGYGYGGIAATDLGADPRNGVPWSAAVYLPMAMAAALMLLRSNGARLFFVVYWPLAQLGWFYWEIRYSMTHPGGTYHSNPANLIPYLVCAIVLFMPAANRYFRGRPPAL